MKVLLLIAFMFSLLSIPQEPETQAPDLIVLKFRSGKYEQGSSMIRSVHDPDTGMNEPMRINQVKNNEPQEAKNRRDLQDRRAEMAITEANAARSSQSPSQIYSYKIQIQNTGPKVVKSFAWEYQPTSEPDPSNRQFYCVANAKPNDKKEYDLYSPLAPSRVIDVSKSDNQNKPQVIINKIEYADGTFWKRMGWNPANFRQEDTSKVGNGKCIGI